MTSFSSHGNTSPIADTTHRRFPFAGYLGLLAIVIGWTTAWMPSHPISTFAFILVWVGLIFTVDGLNFWRSGHSLLYHHPGKFAQMFAFSIPIWWIFEALNARVNNWQYLLDDFFGLGWNPISYNIMSSLCFATVLPAVMEWSTFLTSFRVFRPAIKRGEEPRVARGILIAECVAGIVTIALPLAFPLYCYTMIWLGPLLLLDAFNAAVGRRSAIAHLVHRDWRFIAVVPLATLICGFFWEMWNYYSLPKWKYTVPFVQDWPFFGHKIFEMPLLGYLGYLPFGLEVFAMYQFLLFVTRQQDDALTF